MPTKKPSAKQLAARAKFVKMVRAKAAKSKAAKKVGAIKIVEKGETKLTRPTKVYQQTRTKSGTFKSLKRIAGTKITNMEYLKTNSPFSIVQSRSTGMIIIKYRGTEKVGHIIGNKVIITKTLKPIQIHSLAIFLDKNNLKIS
jgi:hypothetical protein